MRAFLYGPMHINPDVVFGDTNILYPFPGMTSMGLAWYLNGLLIPELWLRRGLTYAFRVYGGNNPHNARTYHPFIITDEPHGGFDRLSEAQQKKVRVLAGVEFLRRGQPRPLAAGALCISSHREKNKRLDDSFPTFKKFNRSLEYSCEKGKGVAIDPTCINIGNLNARNPTQCMLNGR